MADTTDDATVDIATSTTTDDDTSAAFLSAIHEKVVLLRSSFPSENGTATASTTSGPTSSVATVIGQLKIMDRAIVALDASPSLQGIEVISEMSEVAMKCLPEDTRQALAASGSGSDVALELIRRNLTQLPSLAKTLYKATPETLDADEGLRSLYAELASGLELYGALVAKGVNPRRRPWALRLTANFSSLYDLKCVGWRRLIGLVGLTSPTIRADEGAQNGVSEDEEAKGLQVGKGEVITPSRPAERTPPALSKGEVHVLGHLYSMGTDVPPIRKQALDFGLGLDVADQLEDSNITTSSKLTESTIRTLQTKLKVPGKTEEDIKAALMAMVSNKTQKDAAAKITASTDDKDTVFGSYDTNEELVAAAGGGMALYGINFFPNENDVTLKPYAPILKKPAFVEMAGASASFEASVLHSTEQSMATTFTKTTENGGISIAQASSTSWGVSASVSCFGGAASASISAEGKSVEHTKGESKGCNAFSANNKKTTTSATTVEVIKCPMKSFRIPVSTMTMSEEALDSALQVDTLLKASRFLDTFGSHVSNGRHLLGGVFFRTMTMTSETEVDTSTLLAAASTQMEASKQGSVEGGASAKTFGVSISPSASMGSASSSGVVTFHSSAGKAESEAEDSRAMFQTYVRSMGPTVSTPELFAEALFTDTSSWTVIDRGPFEALVPVTHVLNNMLSSFDPRSPGKLQLENASDLLTVAWQQRAAVWKPLEEDVAVPVSLRHMIGRSFATEDAHDQIRAAVISLFEVDDLPVGTNTEEAAEALSAAVLSTAKEMEGRPAGDADFFKTLHSKVGSLEADMCGKFSFKESSPEYEAADWSTKKLSSTDWVGFDLIWNKRMGNIALRNALDSYLKSEKATLRLGESLTIEEPLVSVNHNFRLEISGMNLQVVNVEAGVVVDIVFQGDGNLGNKTSAHIDAKGAFVLDLTMITGFDRTKTEVVLWMAPNTDGNKGSYARMQDNGKFVVFSKNGKKLWST